jgi:hypothetical protein
MSDWQGFRGFEFTKALLAASFIVFIEKEPYWNDVSGQHLNALFFLLVEQQFSK